MKGGIKLHIYLSWKWIFLHGCHALSSDEISQLKQGMGQQRRNCSSSPDFFCLFSKSAFFLVQKVTPSALSTHLQGPREKPVPSQLMHWCQVLIYNKQRSCWEMGIKCFLRWKSCLHCSSFQIVTACSQTCSLNT